MGVELAGVRGAAGLTLEAAVVATRASHTGVVLGAALASRLLIVLGASMLPEAAAAGTAVTVLVSCAAVDVAGVRSAATLALEVAAVA